MIAARYSITYANVYIYMHMHAYVYECLCVNEMNDRSDKRDRQMEELGMFCYYKVLVLPVKCYLTVDLN